MFRRWMLMGRMAVLAAATLLTAISAGAAQENGGYFKQLEAQGWYGNGGNGSNSYYRQPPRYRSYSYYGQPYVSPRQEYYSNAVVDQRARIHLQVPLGARVWFDNEKTAQTGSSRDFITPPLPAGREYSYTVRVEWTENGRKRESTRRIGIHAGDRVSLDMSNPTLARTTPE